VRNDAILDGGERFEAQISKLSNDFARFFRTTFLVVCDIIGSYFHIEDAESSGSKSGDEVFPSSGPVEDAKAHWMDQSW
jgi:hypothetical protein